MNNLGIIQEAWLGAGTLQHVLPDDCLVFDFGLVPLIYIYGLNLVVPVNAVDYVLFHGNDFADCMDYIASVNGGKHY